MSDETVSQYSRPKQWHCIYCGWRCDEEYNDYLCKQCNALRPFAGGSATMVRCAHCAQMSLALASYCEWCGRSLQPEALVFPTRDDGISYMGGPGDMPERAIVIQGATSYREGIAAEYEYLEARFGPPPAAWSLRKQTLEGHAGRTYDRLDITLVDGSDQTFFFDISEFFGRR
jgi:hypothetical protein